MGPSEPAAASGAIVARTRQVTARRRWGRALAVALFAIAAGLIALLAGDALASLGDAARWWLGRGWLLAALAATAAGLAARPFLAPARDRAVRLAEHALEDRDRLLTCALELEGRDDPLARHGAGQLAGRLRADGLAERLPRARSGIWLAGIGLLAAATGTIHLLEPSLAPALLPRLRDPYGDHPPWSATTLRFATAPPAARPGSPARFEVASAGRERPDLALELVVRRDGMAEERIPMFRIGRNRFAAEIARVAGPATVWAEGAGTRTFRHRLALDPVPELRTLDLRLESPAWSGLPPEAKRLAPGEQAQFKALTGSRLVLQPSANRPLAALWLGRDGSRPARLPLVQGGAATAALPGTWSLVLESEDGTRSDPLPMLQIAERPDAAPELRILRPERDCMATPDSRIPFHAKADDDLGLVTLIKVRSHNGLEAPQLLLRLEGKEAHWEQALDLADLGVAPGDTLLLGAVAKDCHPGEGQLSPFVARSIRIVSEEEYNRSLRQRLSHTALLNKYKPLVDRLRELEQEAARLRQEAKGLDRNELARRLSELARKARELGKEVRALHRTTPLFAIETDLQRELREALDALASAAESGDPQNLPQGPGEMLAADLKALTELARAAGTTQLLKRLIDAEQNTVQRLDPLAEHRKPSDADRVRLRELGEDEQQLAEALDEWRRLEAEAAERLRPRHARQAAMLDALAAELEKSGAAELKRQAAAAARAGDGREARNKAAAARDRLLALLPQTEQANLACGGAGFGWCSGRDASDAIGGLGSGFGLGTGGIGTAGLGAFLGYGGQDLGATLVGASNDLYGPENLGGLGGDRNADDARANLARMAAGGERTRSRGAAGYQTAQRPGATAVRVPLSKDEERLIGEYFRKLGGGK